MQTLSLRVCSAPQRFENVVESIKGWVSGVWLSSQSILFMLSKSYSGILYHTFEFINYWLSEIMKGEAEKKSHEHMQK